MMVIKPCCADPRNLRRLDTGRADLVVHMCRQCYCRHYRMVAEPGHFNLRGVQLGTPVREIVG